MNTFVIREGNYLAAVEERSAGWYGTILHSDGLSWSSEFHVGPGTNGFICGATYKRLHDLLAAEETATLYPES